MYLYQGQLLARIETIMESLSITDAEIRTWLLTAYVKHCRNGKAMIRQLFVGAYEKDKGRPASFTITWSDAPQEVREALMRDEPLQIVPATAADSDEIAACVRALNHMRVDRKLTSLSGIDAEHAIKLGGQLLKSDRTKALKEDARKGIVSMGQQMDGLELVGLFTHGALDVAGEHLLNCLRGTFDKAPQDRFDKGVTYFALRSTATGRIRTIAEIQYLEVEHAALPEQKSLSVVSHLAASNTSPSEEQHRILRELVSKVYGSPCGPFTRNLAEDYYVRVFRLQDGVPILDEGELIKITQFTDGLTEWQHTLLVHARRFMRNTSALRFDWAERLQALQTGLASIRTASRAMVDSINSQAIVSAQVAPEVSNRGRITVQVLKHRNAQRACSVTVPSNLIRGMTQRLNDVEYDAFNDRVIHMPRAVTIHRSEAAGVIVPDSVQEGDRRGTYRYHITAVDAVGRPIISPSNSNADRLETGINAFDLLGGFRRDELVVLGACTGGLDRADGPDRHAVFVVSGRITSAQPNLQEIPNAQNGHRGWLPMERVQAEGRMLRPGQTPPAVFDY